MKRTKKNGFTLIELLVVVAIIGIISSIGVVAYNGYTKGAKKAVIKMNHNTISKQFKIVSVRCDIDGYLNMMPNFNSTQVQSVDCPIHETTLINHIENESKLRSPYMTSERAQQNGACDQSHIDKQLGYNFVGRSNKNIIICSCIDTPCSIKANRIETSVVFYE